MTYYIYTVHMYTYTCIYTMYTICIYMCVCVCVCVCVCMYYNSIVSTYEHTPY